MLWDRKSGAEFFTPTPLCFNHYLVFLFLLFLHRLVGLRRMRLCLILRSGLCPKNPQGTLSLDPASPQTPGLSLRFISRFARCFFYFVQVIYSVWLCQFLTPHSSLNSAPHFNREVYPQWNPASRPRLLLSHRYRKLSQTSGL